MLHRRQPFRYSLIITTALLTSFILLMNACIPDFLVSNPELVVIEGGDHEPLPKRKVGIDLKPTELSATVTFDSTCIYDIGTVDEQDWNKVIGLGFVGSSTDDITSGVPPHQIDGARIGWRWNPQRQRIDLGAYVYINGQLTSFKIAETPINQPTQLTIKVDYDRKLYQIMGGKPIAFTHGKTFAYKTGLYFGGNQPAPHQIRVKIKY